MDTMLKVMSFLLCFSLLALAERKATLVLAVELVDDGVELKGVPHAKGNLLIVVPYGRHGPHPAGFP